MRAMNLAPAALLLCAAAALASDRPLIGDVVHGDRLLAKAGQKAKVDGAWLAAFSDDAALAALQKGTSGFPAIEGETLDQWDVLASYRSRNVDLRDLAQDADTVLIFDAKLDENAEKRLRDQASIKEFDSEGRVFVTYRTGTAGDDLARVGVKETRKRDTLKKDKKVGYIVFVPLRGVRGGGAEAAFAFDKDIRITGIEVRTKDGAAPDDLNQAAARFVGKGARGQYTALKPAGAAKALGELQKPLSDAFLQAAELAYMYEVDERDYFAFD